MKPNFLFPLFLIFLLVANDIKAQEEPCVITINYKNNSNHRDKILFHTLDNVPKLIDSLDLPDTDGKVSFIYKGDDTWSQISIQSYKYASGSFITSSGEIILEVDCEKKTFDVLKSNKKTEGFERTNDELRAFLLKFVRQKMSLDSSISTNDTINIRIKEKKLNTFLKQEYSSFISKAKNEPFYQISALIAVHLSKQCTKNKLRYVNECLNLYDFLTQKFPNTTTFTVLKDEFIRENETSEVGKNFKIPDNLLLKNIDGEQKSLNETIEKSNSKIIITEFWASWCGPCRQNHPEIIKLSNQYPSLEIIFISIDENDENWVKAIQKDNLTKFKHLSDDSGWQARVLRENNISQIPFNAVFDSKRQIIGTNIYGSDLENLIKKSLENK
ncbi:MAG: TlpA family protein disulfide reductase [Emticicia sp.]